MQREVEYQIVALSDPVADVGVDRLQLVGELLDLCEPEHSGTTFQGVQIAIDIVDLVRRSPLFQLEQGAFKAFQHLLCLLNVFLLKFVDHLNARLTTLTNSAVSNGFLM